MAKRATDELLGLLHEAVAAELLAVIKSGEATPGHFSAAIKLLKDNHIESRIEEGDKLDQLYKSLPVFDDEDDDHVSH